MDLRLCSILKSSCTKLSSFEIYFSGYVVNENRIDLAQIQRVFEMYLALLPKSISSLSFSVPLSWYRIRPSIDLRVDTIRYFRPTMEISAVQSSHSGSRCTFVVGSFCWRHQQ